MRLLSRLGLRVWLLGGTALATAVIVASACSGSSSSSTAGASAAGGGEGGASTPPVPFDAGGRVCTGVTRSTAPDTTEPLAVPAGIVVTAGFVIEAVAKVPSARHVAALPNGDLLVGTGQRLVYLVPHADAARAGTPSVFLDIDDAPVHGVTFHAASCSVLVGSHQGVYRIAYQDAQTTGASGDPIARVRTEDTGGHATTSVAVAGAYLYASVGSSCNACVESDPTRATVQRMNLDGSGMTTYAKRIRNAIALVENPDTGTLWAGNAGQDGLPEGHPYEFFDAVTAHPLGADYGWPDCEENNHAYAPGASCAAAVAPRVVLPAYSTLIGAAFYPTTQAGAHAFPAALRGGAFITAHGAWHTTGDAYFSAPRVAYVAMEGDTPKKAVDWSDPSTQWTDFVSGFETADRKTRIGRPAGIAVGPDGSLFVTDDQNGLVYRVRPAP